MASPPRPVRSSPVADRSDGVAALRPLFVLASASPRRAELLARLGVRPTIRPVDVDESPSPAEAGSDLAVRLARSKAGASAALGDGDEVVLAADTVVVIDGRPLGKPRDPDEAAVMLHTLSGRTHEVLTGVVARRSGRDHHDLVRTLVTFRTLSATEIAWYVATGEPDDKAGAYGIQGAGAVLVERIDGSDTNVIGLPLPATVALLRMVGVDLLQPDAGSDGPT